MARITFIDTDPGTDDAIAIWLALASPELDVQLITVVGGNVGLAATTRNARAIVGLSGREVEVVAGSDRALLGAFVDAAHVHGDDGLGGVRLPDGPALAPGLACDVLRERLRAAAQGSVTLVGIGPATNLALALIADPALVDRVAEIVLMSGAIGEGNITPSAEFNAYCDPEALAILLGMGAPITLATLDLTNQALCEPRHVDAMRSCGAGACVAATVAIWERVAPSRRSGSRGHEQHDACAVAWLIAPDRFRHVAAQVSVDLAGPGRGRTIVDRWGRSGAPENARLLLSVDSEAFFQLLRERIGRLP